MQFVLRANTEMQKANTRWRRFQDDTPKQFPSKRSPNGKQMLSAYLGRSKILENELDVMPMS